jgi:hypothetical protein
MGLFANILEKLGFKKPAASAAPAAAVPTQSTSVRNVRPGPAGMTGLPPQGVHSGPGIAPAPQTLAPQAIPPHQTIPAMQMVDVVGKLDGMTKSNPEKLDWKVSIVDMLKLLGMDSSLTARKELATELGCPANLMSGDYSQMNVWLHKTVLQKIAENGGNIPQSLLK